MITIGGYPLKRAISSRHPDVGVSTGTFRPPVPKTTLQRDVHALLHRRRANCALTRAAFYRLGSVSDRNCVLCGDSEDTEHVL